MTDDWRAGLPAPGERRLALRATGDAIRQIRAGDPWLYDRSIKSVSHDGAAGDLAVVFDDHRRFVAIGLWDPDSPIRVKLLHAGKPVTIDDDWWRDAMATSIARRQSLADDPSTTAYRLVHGENDGLPGLIVDRYDTTLVAKLYTSALIAHLGAIVAGLTELANPQRIVLRLARNVAAGESFGLHDGMTLVGEPPGGPILFRERGLVMEADVVRGQKTGHFLDQRDNRALVRGIAAGADLLDVFSSTGGFALAAAAGGARSVHMVDLAAPAVAAAERNLAHNRNLRQVRECNVRSTVGDAFRVLDTLGHRAGSDADRFDVVVLDPPSFAMNQASVDRALGAYAKLTRLGVGLLRRGGTLVQASCSSRVTSDQFFETVHAAAQSAGRPLHEIRRTAHALDHPIGFQHGAYLKAILATA